MVFFIWTGFDEMNEITSDGHAKLHDDGSIEGTFAYFNGDEAILKTGRDTSPTTCLKGAAAAGLSWPLPDDLTDDATKSKLFAFGDKLNHARAA